MTLTEDDVVQILKWIEESSFSEFHLETGDLKLTVRKGACQTPESLGESEREPERPAPADISAIHTEATKPVSQPEMVETAEEKDLVPVLSPMLGIFYRCPAPGAPPYVEVGSVVSEDDTVCLIEVMKVFNAVKAGVRGRIQKICAESGQLVEYGQPLFYIRPETVARSESRAA